jgi:hypothetical protein
MYYVAANCGMKTHEEGVGMAPLILKFSTRRRWPLRTMWGEGEPSAPLRQEAVRAPERE